MSFEIKIILGMIFLLGILSGLLMISIYPVGPAITAAILKYIWVFIGSAFLITLVLNRIFEGLFKQNKDKTYDY